MPSYDYHCPDNNQVVEVKHRMSESLSTWGEVCARTDVELGSTPADAPVERYIAESGGVAGISSGGYSAPAPACGARGFT